MAKRNFIKAKWQAVKTAIMTRRATKAPLLNPGQQPSQSDLTRISEWLRDIQVSMNRLIQDPYLIRPQSPSIGSPRPADTQSTASTEDDWAFGSPLTQSRPDTTISPLSGKRHRIRNFCRRIFTKQPAPIPPAFEQAILEEERPRGNMK